MSQETATEIVRLRRRYPDWGPIKLLDWLERRRPELALPAPCTAAELLKREGLVKPRGRKRHSTPYGAPFVEAVHPMICGAPTSRASFGWAMVRFAIRSP